MSSIGIWLGVENPLRRGASAAPRAVPCRSDKKSTHNAIEALGGRSSVPRAETLPYEGAPRSQGNLGCLGVSSRGSSVGGLLLC